MDKKFSKKDYLNITILTLFVIAIVLILTRGKYLYGSTTDWKDQHYLLAEYFRNMFYATGKLIPELALNIGGGQNIFNFAYYGLLNPIILVSYLLPFIDMMHYVMISSILIVIISIILFYKWLKNNNISSNICFLVSFIFAASSPLILHSHRHIMFINYMPFLLLGLMGIDKYFKDKKFYLITISTSLMIFTSYYYSVSGIVVLGIYFIYKYLSLNEKFEIKNFLLNLLKFGYFIILGILIAAVLLLPVFSTILSGRNVTTKDVNILSLFIPNLDMGYILYNSYGVGLTSIAIISLVSLLFYKGKDKKFLLIILIIILCIPLFLYLLNGTLYINAKILIPFLPLICYIISYNLTKIINNEFPLKHVTVAMIILIIASYFTNSHQIFYGLLIDSLIIMLGISLFTYKNNKLFIYIPIVIISLITCIVSNLSDELYLKTDYEKIFNADIDKDINKIIENDQDFYRINNNLSTLSTSNKVYNEYYYQSSLYSSTYNGYYNNFYVNVFQNEIPYRNSAINGETNNLLYQMYMGEKYIITKNNPNLGYELVDETDNYQIYKNENVLPIGYASDSLLSYKDYEKLSYPYNIDALLNYVIVDEDLEANYESNIEEYDISSLESKISDLEFTKEDNIYRFDLTKEKTLNIPLENKLNNKILIISFDMKLSQSCSKGDTYIIINGIKNKLTCKSWKYHNNNYTFNYVLATPNIDALDIQFSKGEFLIDNIKAYTLDYNKIKNINQNIDIFNVDYDSLKENKIIGNIDVKNDGYFILKVPFDKGFEIYIDDYKTNLENIDDGFIGTKLESGKHNIEIIYHAPFLLLGKIISLIGIILFIISIIVNNHFESISNKIMNNKLVKFGLKKYKQYEEIINYLFMGGCTTIVSIGTYTIFTSLFSVHYQISNVISWFFAVAFAFITNKLFVFKVKSNDKLLFEIYQFVKFRILSLIIDMICMYILVDLFSINDIIAKILVQVIVVVLNYVFSKLFIFKKKD